MILLFVAGALSYIVNPHLGGKLLKNAAVLLAALLIGPSMIRLVIDQIPSWLLVALAAAASLAAYRRISSPSAQRGKQEAGASSRQTERRPRMPHDAEDQ